MIPKASQRGLGQDLATHLQNAYDNEYLEIAELRGAVASDLHGAFAEWEVCAHAMTGCRNYLYSLSVNPDPAQGQLTRAQYLDYVDRVEAKLNLSGQPRAIVFHIKEGREHCHVVWSRIDVEHSKAVHQAFDHQKLMMVTREFAREHGLALPDAGRAAKSGGSRSTRSISRTPLASPRKSASPKLPRPGAAATAREPSSRRWRIWATCWRRASGPMGGFKRSSQHDLCRLIGETGQEPLRVSSNQASFGAAS